MDSAFLVGGTSRPRVRNRGRRDGPSPHCEASLKGYRRPRRIDPYLPGVAAPAPGAAQLTGVTGVGAGRTRRTVLLAADGLGSTAVTARVTTGLGTFASGPSGWCAASNTAPLGKLKRSGGPLICTQPQRRRVQLGCLRPTAASGCAAARAEPRAGGLAGDHRGIRSSASASTLQDCRPWAFHCEQAQRRPWPCHSRATSAGRQGSTAVSAIKLHRPPDLRFLLLRLQWAG